MNSKKITTEWVLAQAKKYKETSTRYVQREKGTKANRQKIAGLLDLNYENLLTLLNKGRLTSYHKAMFYYLFKYLDLKKRYEKLQEKLNKQKED